MKTIDTNKIIGQAKKMRAEEIRRIEGLAAKRLGLYFRLLAGSAADGRYGDNPNRLYKHHQYQVILKPAPKDVQDLYLDSLRALGIEPADHDVRFEEDNWESPALGA